MLNKGDLNLKKARAVKQKSPVDCFVGSWCESGYCEQEAERSLSTADAKHMRPVTSSKKNLNLLTDKTFFIAEQLLAVPLLFRSVCALFVKSLLRNTFDE